jgi:hypothetical protein
MRYKRLILLLIFLQLALCAAERAQAQSGRRAKGGSPPPSTPKPVSTPAENGKGSAKATAETEAQRLPLIITADEHAFESVYAPVNASNSILDGFVERLKKSSAFNLKVEKEMGRGRASDLARKQTEAYLVWLHFGSDVVSARRHDEPDYYLDYVVFTPATAKVKTEGKIYLRLYQRSASVGGVPVRLPVPQTDSRAAWESALKQAGSDAAERIMGEFDVIVR